jgi:hypothetical protein
LITWCFAGVFPVRTAAKTNFQATSHLQNHFFAQCEHERTIFFPWLAWKPTFSYCSPSAFTSSTPAGHSPRGCTQLLFKVRCHSSVIFMSPSKPTIGNSQAPPRATGSTSTTATGSACQLHHRHKWVGIGENNFSKYSTIGSIYATLDSRPFDQVCFPATTDLDVM